MTTEDIIDGYYLRRWENQSMRPYFTAIILDVYHMSLKQLLGFSYRKNVQIVSSGMNNAAYFEEQEMAQATVHFASIWREELQNGKVRAEVRKSFKKAEALEQEASGSNWREMTDAALVEAVEQYRDGAKLAMSRMVISQPWHVMWLEEQLEELLNGRSNRDILLQAATYCADKLPWDDEDAEIRQLHDKWPELSDSERNEILSGLVNKYGWLNDVEGDKPFDVHHYRRKVETFAKKSAPELSDIDVPAEIDQLGQLIGELGNLRFWSRYHWMQLRYHIKSIYREVLRRKDQPELEYATVDELTTYLGGGRVDFELMGARQDGYIGYVDSVGKVVLVTGAEAKMIRDRVESGSVSGKILKKVRGRVRVISFADVNYHDEVDAFKAGEILVTGMTRPQIVHLVKLASGIITDEGGITSHAAVVSREFNIPCVIGTQSATDMLKTGDQVDLDADKGVVTIL